MNKNNNTSCYGRGKRTLSMMGSGCVTGIPIFITNALQPIRATPSSMWKFSTKHKRRPPAPLPPSPRVVAGVWARRVARRKARGLPRSPNRTRIVPIPHNNKPRINSSSSSTRVLFNHQQTGKSV